MLRAQVYRTHLLAPCCWRLGAEWVCHELLFTLLGFWLWWRSFLTLSTFCSWSLPNRSRYLLVRYFLPDFILILACIFHISLLCLLLLHFLIFLFPLFRTFLIFPSLLIWWTGSLHGLGILFDWRGRWRSQTSFVDEFFNSKCRIGFELHLWLLLWIRDASLKTSNNASVVHSWWVSPCSDFLKSFNLLSLLLFIHLVLPRYLRHAYLLAVEASWAIWCQKRKWVEWLVFGVRKALCLCLEIDARWLSFWWLRSNVEAFVDSLQWMLWLLSTQQNVGIDVEEPWFHNLLQRLIMAINWRYYGHIPWEKSTSKHLLSPKRRLVGALLPFSACFPYQCFIDLDEILLHWSRSAPWMRLWLWSWFASESYYIWRCLRLLGWLLFYRLMFDTASERIS